RALYCRHRYLPVSQWHFVPITKLGLLLRSKDSRTMVELWPNFGRGVVVANPWHLYGILIASYYYPITILIASA
ncbi:MAG: hypothetical protein ACXVBZ_13000, partial [Flavisolibacter sp.]